MSFTWFRLYADLVDDPKIESLTHAQRWLWITVLCLACRSPIRGKLLLSSGERSRNDAGTETELTPVPTRIIAKKAEMTVEEVESTLLLFDNLGMMERADGVWAVSHWDKRQFKSDDVTARTQKHKAKKKETEQEGNVPENVPGTPQITDNRSIKSPHNPPRGNTPRSRRATTVYEYSPDFERFWSVYPKERRERKAEAFECWNARLTEGVDPEDLITAATNYAAARVGWEAKHILQPTTFLGPNNRWSEFMDPQTLPSRTPTGRPGERPFYPVNEFSR